MRPCAVPEAAEERPLHRLARRAGDERADEVRDDRRNVAAERDRLALGDDAAGTCS